MLGKLLKYEFRATGRVFLPFFGALLIVSIVSRVIGSISSFSSAVPALPEGPYVIGMVLSIMLMVAVFVVAFILMIQRFAKNLIGDEGYLMFTLPVRVDSLIFSKLIVSAVWFIVSVIVVVISIVIMSLMDIGQAFNAIRITFGEIFNGNIGDVLLVAQAVITPILALFTTALTFYMCISLSMLANRRRGLLSFGIFLLYCIVAQTITALLNSAGLGIIGTNFTYQLFTVGVDGSFVSMVNRMFLRGIVTNLIQGTIMYAITRYMLRRRLNLE